MSAIEILILVGIVFAVCFLMLGLDRIQPHGKPKSKLEDKGIVSGLADALLGPKKSPPKSELKKLIRGHEVDMETGEILEYRQPTTDEIYASLERMEKRSKRRPKRVVYAWADPQTRKVKLSKKGKKLLKGGRL
jgi:hypothetical protein